MRAILVAIAGANGGRQFDERGSHFTRVGGGPNRHWRNRVTTQSAPRRLQLQRHRRTPPITLSGVAHSAQLPTSAPTAADSPSAHPTGSSTRSTSNFWRSHFGNTLAGSGASVRQCGVFVDLARPPEPPASPGLPGVLSDVVQFSPIKFNSHPIPIRNSEFQNPQSTAPATPRPRLAGHRPQAEHPLQRDPTTSAGRIHRARSTNRRTLLRARSNSPSPHSPRQSLILATHKILPKPAEVFWLTATLLSLSKSKR